MRNLRDDNRLRRKGKSALECGKRGILCLMLLIFALLSGCGGKRGDSAPSDEGEPSNARVILRVNKEDVTESEGRLYFQMLQDRYEGLFGDEVWSLHLPDDTLWDTAMNELLEEIIQVRILCQRAEKETIVVDQVDLMACLEDAETYYAQLSEETKNRYHISQADVEKVYADWLLAETVYSLLTSDTVPEIPDEDARVCRVYALFYADRNPSGADIGMAQISKMREEVEKLPDAASVRDYMQENTQASEVEFTVGEEEPTLDPAFVKAAREMISGQLSQIVFGADGYYLLYCVADQDEDATAREKSRLVQKAQREFFLSQYEEWERDAKVEEKKDALEDFLRKLAEEKGQEIPGQEAPTEAEQEASTGAEQEASTGAEQEADTLSESQAEPEE